MCLLAVLVPPPWSDFLARQATCMDPAYSLPATGEISWFYNRNPSKCEPAGEEKSVTLDFLKDNYIVTQFSIYCIVFFKCALLVIKIIYHGIALTTFHIYLGLPLCVLQSSQTHSHQSVPAPEELTL